VFLIAPPLRCLSSSHIYIYKFLASSFSRDILLHNLFFEFSHIFAWLHIMYLLPAALLPLAALAVSAPQRPSKQGQGYHSHVSTTSSSSAGTATSSDSLPTVTLDYSTIFALAQNSTVGYVKYQNMGRLPSFRELQGAR
jgi:hypothetical protein